MTNEEILKNFMVDLEADYRERINPDWTIDEDGNLSYRKRYYIMRERLAEGDWISHMVKKRWVKLEDFIPAYFTACMLAGITTLNVTLYGWSDRYKFEKE